MPQVPIPCLFMRGGTSRAPYFNRADLPEDQDALAEILIAAVGAGHPLNIDGVGGGAAVTTKTAMISPSKDDWADIDYFFGQVKVDERLVDFGPTCGNILSGIGPAAIEMGMVPAQDGETRVRIIAVNTGARIEAIVQTPGGQVEYEGAARIDGVPGTAAPITLNFMDVVGSKTGKLFPTGSPLDVVGGVEVTCIDVAMPIVVARASDFGLTGYETAEELDANREFYARFEPIRQEAGKLMGMGDVTKSVTPKFAILSEPRQGGAINARYFMPWNCHPSMAVTGSICLGCCTLAPGTVAEGLAKKPEGSPTVVTIEHPIGQIDVTADYSISAGQFDLKTAGLLRTARLLMRGEMMVPQAAFK
jgi:4-oxalomesaconate tautomerase